MEYTVWADQTWEKIKKKLNRTVETCGDTCFAYTTKNGRFIENQSGEGASWWTNGFWPGINWLMYLGTKDDRYKKVAQSLEEQLDEPLKRYIGLHHDVGFMWLLSAVADYRITGNEQSRIRGWHTANLLAGRYNPAGQFLRAWNDWKDAEDGDRNVGWVIIDSMMNIPLLYWASEDLGDPRFKQIAMRHADTVLAHFIRPDGSVNHIVGFDPDTGEMLQAYGGQGYGVGSAWTRGQGWAIYGFTLSYIHTGETRYLDAAKRVAHFFIANLAEDPVPRADFRAPKDPVYYDTTAGALAACGLIEISRHVDEFESELYRNAAVRILQAIEERFCDWTENEDSIVQMGSEAYHSGQNIPIIYADYYFIEAIQKLRGETTLLW